MRKPLALGGIELSLTGTSTWLTTCNFFHYPRFLFSLFSFLFSLSSSLFPLSPAPPPSIVLHLFGTSGFMGC